MDYWQNYFYGYFMPETTQFVNSSLRKADFHKFRTDFKKNTGRDIKYQYMRGYNPEMLWREYGAESGNFTKSRFSYPLSAPWKKAWSSPAGGSVRNMIDLF